MYDTIQTLVNEYEEGRISRRMLIAQLAATATAMAGMSMRAAAQPQSQESAGEGSKKQESTFEAIGVDHVALAVPDVQRSREFYQKHLGLELMGGGGERSAFLRCGDDFLALFRGDEAKLHHFCFAISDYDADEAVKKLQEAGLGHRREANRVYFDDPDGLEVQVSAE